jgi:hypothetical protein
MAAGVGNAFVRGPSPPSAGSPRLVTSASTIRTVALHAQFVVHTVFTTSSNTVGERSIRPAPRAAHARSGSSVARR